MTPIPWTINDIMAATGGERISGACPEPFSMIRIDSRIIEPRDVFVAIQGPRFDGHDFIDAVVEAGAGCVVVSRDQAGCFTGRNVDNPGTCCIAVDDTIKALGDLASYRRRQAGIPVIAITGSTGKTTAREMLTAICRRRFETLSTLGNLNNEIGLPLTLFNLSSEHRLAILELGMNHPGEIRRLSAICRPDIGVITNVGPAHLEGLRDVASVARAKGELLENISPAGVAILNADDAFVRELKESAKCRTVLFGKGEDARVRAENIARNGEKVSFTLAIAEARIDIILNVYGEFMVQNALAAAAVADQLKIGPEDIKAGLERFYPVEGRMRIYETSPGVYIIDDTYNANPMSMEAAINSLAGFTGKRRGFLIAGDMLELGDSARHYHERIGRIAGSAGIYRIYLTGAYAAQVAQGAKSAGMAGSNIFVGTKTDIVKDLCTRLQQGDWVLVKGSRSTGMEEIVSQMTVDAQEYTPANET